jgi:hypothetical protein
MRETLFTAQIDTTKQLRIEIVKRLYKPFALDCNQDRTGIRMYRKMPQYYPTVREAKEAATLLLGVELEWKAVEPGAIPVTVTEKTVEEFTKGIGGSRFAELFRILVLYGLRPLGKSNTGTLLFQWIDKNGTAHNVLAFRREPAPVLSFPQSYWQSRKELRSGICATFTSNEQPSTIRGVGSHSNESAGQVALNKDTFERLKATCDDVCNYVKTVHA